MRILLVEDDELLGDGIFAGLAEEGLAIDWVRDGRQAASALGGAAPYDAVVLDLGLPGLDGLQVLRGLRGGGNATPVLILSARGSVADRIAGLDTGADDYLAKPFDLGELKARLRALVRRPASQGDPVLRNGDLVLDPATHRVSLGGRPVELSPREFTVLHELLRNAGRVMSRAQLEAKVYGWGDEVESNAVEVFVHHLRRKLGSGRVRTVRGVGYMIPREDR